MTTNTIPNRPRSSIRRKFRVAMIGLGLSVAGLAAILVWLSIQGEQLRRSIVEHGHHVGLIQRLDISIRHMLIINDYVVAAGDKSKFVDYELLHQDALAFLHQVRTFVEHHEPTATTGAHSNHESDHPSAPASAEIDSMHSAPPTEVELIERVVDDALELHRATDEIVRLVDPIRGPRASELIQRADDAALRIINVLDRLNEQAEEDMEAATLTAQQVVRATRRVALTILLLALCLSGYVLWLLSRKVVRPLVQLSRDIDRIRGGGDPATHVAVPSSQELNQVANAFNAMLDRLTAGRLALTKERNLLRTLIDNLPDCHIFVKDTESQFVTTNAAHLQTLGAKTVEEVIGKTDFAFFSRELAAQYYADEQEVIRSGQPLVNREEPCIDEAGHRTWLLTTKVPLRDGQGKIVGLVGLSRDITERKRAEEALLHAAEEWQSTFDAIEDLVAIIDKDFRVVRANQAMRNAFSDATVIGAHCYELFHASEGPTANCPVHQAFRSGQAIEVDVYEQHLDGRWFNIFAYPIKDKDGTVQQVVHVVRDITARKQAESEQQTLEEQLRQSQKMEAVGKLAGGVAHDFNNLLTGITGYTQFALDELPAEDQTARNLIQVRELAGRAAGLTRQLLAFSRKQRLEPVALNINALVEDSLKMLQRLIREDIDMEFVPALDIGTVRADPGQIEQVLMNLAVNARDAMPKGGKLTIETANVTLDQEYADRHVAAKPGPYVMLAVTDSGCGMDKATQERIFEPFFTTKEVGKGTGLGLSTVYGIVKQHDGNICVYSEPGKGTTFRIYLPRVDAKAQELAEKAQEARALEGTETILVVEDEEAVRAIAQRILEKQGYAIVTATCRDEAEEVFAQCDSEVALLLTDVIMPGGNGRDLYERLAAEQPSLKVLYMSGYTDNSIVHHGVLDEGTPFMQKPFTSSTLAQKIREVLDG